MKRFITGAICVKEIFFWTVGACCCVLAEGVSVKEYLEGTAAGE